MLSVLPFLVVGLVLNVAYPEAFEVGGPSDALWALSIVMLAAGLVMWIWSAILVVTKVPRGELITGGPFAVVKHPIYTGVALLVMPSLGFLFNTWLGLAVGIVMYLATRRFAPEEDAALASEFGSAWQDYRASVLLPWL